MVASLTMACTGSDCPSVSVHSPAIFPKALLQGCESKRVVKNLSENLERK
jgi:hypothetical protein